jgi:hypothetical protein
LTENGIIRYIGVDLGQQRDYTAISITERVLLPTGNYSREPYYDWDAGLTRSHTAQETRPEYRVRHLERPALGTSYVDVVERILELLGSLAKLDKELVLAVDTTGVGRPLADMLKRHLEKWLEKNRQVRLSTAWITITGGDSVTKAEGGGLRVPKRDLASAPLVLMQNGQLKIAAEMPLADTLRKELLNFKVKINISTAHDSYEAWREGDHDDLVLSVALACWTGERFPIRSAPLYVF